MTADTFELRQHGKVPALDHPILVEGLPGIGNVGKVAVDFMVDELNARKLYDISSDAFPHSVFVDEDNTVELPRMEIYYAKRGKGQRDLLFVCGDVQPVDERATYGFCRTLLHIAKKHKVSTIVTLGGIGLNDIPEKPALYVTGTSKKAIKPFAVKGVSADLHGVVGPIMGVSGILAGMAPKNGIEGVIILAETYGHPMYLGIRGSREMLKVLSASLKLRISIQKLEKEIKEIESELKGRQEQPEAGSKQHPRLPGQEMNYIG